ncbi:MAG: hypothetical protein H7A25_03890 [Leptospiraceae bacterium]|nr:hypothetical protein [Leptospiraceae bacterium]MCP5499017.1 hypothetical protein [Leptospiraceae bacterium]
MKSGFFLFVIFLMITCTGEKSSKPLSPEEEKRKRLEEVFSGNLKKYNFKKLADGSFSLSIEYGGSMALTFFEQDRYAEYMKKIHAFYVYKTFLSLDKLNSLQLSLVKPYYVNYPDLNKEMIEEFEIFRISVDRTILNPVLEKKVPEDYEKGSAKKKFSPEMLIIINSIISKWKVELDEFHRVEIK